MPPASTSSKSGIKTSDVSHGLSINSFSGPFQSEERIFFFTDNLYKVQNH